MNATERLNLKKMLAQSNEYVDHTEDIRRVKHSGVLLEGMRQIEILKRKHPEIRALEYDRFTDMCKEVAPIMYNLYTDLFHKLVKDELNLVIMVKLIRVLELIEQEQIDQSEGSVMVGKMLKELYVDSAVRCGNNLDRAREDTEAGVVPDTSAREPTKTISWEQWKITRN